MSDRFESEIRKALDEKAYEVEVPEGLGASTLARAATVSVRLPLVGRVRAWRDARRMQLPAAGYPRWLLAPGAVVAVVALFAIGTLGTMEPRGPKSLASTLGSDDNEAEIIADPMSGDDEDAANQSGVTSSGDASVDASNTSEDVDINTGDASGTNDASGFTGMTAGSDTVMDLPALKNVGAETPQLVQQADIRVAVSNFEKSWAEANDIAAEHGGAVIDSKTKQVADEIAQGTIRMRVDSNKLDAVLADLRQLGTLAQLDTSGDDISKQMADVEEKTTDAETKEKELKELEARASTVSETIDIRNRLEDVRKDIDNLDKKQKALRDQVDTSIVNATIFQDEVAAGKGASIIGSAVRTSGKLFLTILAGGLVLAGALLPLALIAGAIWLVLRRLKGRRSA